MPEFYSQNGEDFLLWEFFVHKKSGFYIDVGAFDGIHLSNTYVFEKEGWSGICIDAHPFYFRECKKNRPNAICIHAACTGDESVKELIFYSEELGLLSGIDTRNDIRKRYEGRGLKFEGFKKDTVPAVTLNGIVGSIEEKPEIDFISIDVEGHELEVLRGLDISLHHPRVLVVEANTEEDEKALDSYLVEKNGYFKSRRVVENVFYCREKRDAIGLQQIRIDCKLNISEHPLGKKYNLPQKSKGSESKGLLSKIVNKLKG